MPTARTSLTPKATKPILARLRRANARFARSYPGDPIDRQPVHTVYGGAHLFKADSARRLGDLAMKTLGEYAPGPQVLAEALGMSGHADSVYSRVKAKLAREPVEDYRIDFEDGYGNRPDSEEDAEAVRTAQEVAKGWTEGTLPPFIGIRIKPLSAELHTRALRTLDIFLTSLAGETKGALPQGFVVTLPKVTIPEQVSATAELLARLERKVHLAPGSVRLEIMVETPQSILGPTGEVPLRALVAAGAGRCRGAHFGTYDYTASCNITAGYQSMDHPACDFARHVMQVSLAGSGVLLSDGATNVMPVPPHRADARGLTADQIRDNHTVVRRAWRLHYDQVRHSLAHAYYQGWDLHPAQLPTRYAAVYAFFLEGLDAAVGRLRGFTEKAAQATLLGEVFDDAATGQGLLNFFLRGLSCGALTAEEVSRTGLTIEEIQSRSFLRILEGRRGLGSRSK
jgi:citrate lyase beta subunit